MKSKCSFIFKASTALVLALLVMLGSIATVIAATFEHGGLAATGASVDLAETGYSKIYVYTSGSENGTYTQKTSFSGNSGSFTIDMTANQHIYFYMRGDSGNDYFGGDYTLPYNSQYNIGKYYNSVSNVKKIHFQATNGGGTYTFTVTDLTGNDPKIKATGGGTGGGGTGGGGSVTPVTPTKETNDDLIAVLKGTKIYIYYGTKFNNVTGTQYVYKDENNSYGTQVISGSSTQKNIDNSNGYFASGAIPTGLTIKVTHNTDWKSPDAKTPAAGDAVYTYSSNGDKTGHAVNQLTLAFNASKKSDSVVVGATSCNIEAVTNSTESNKKYMVEGTWNPTIEYWYTSDNTNFYKFDPSALPTDGTIAAGTYTVYAAAKNNEIYIASSDTATLVVYPRLTQPTIKIDGSANSSVGVTASPTTKSTLAVTNVNSYTEGTVFKLYKDTTLVSSNTSGTFTLGRNTNNNGTYKLIASPGASDTTHSDSLASTNVTFTVTKIAAPATPTITASPAVINTNGSVTLTMGNFASFDLDQYDLKLYSCSTSNGTYTEVSGKKFTAASLIYTVGNSAGTTYYKIKAVSKDSTIYADSALSTTAASIRVAAPNWYSYGLTPFGKQSGSQAWSQTDSYHVNNYYQTHATYGDVFFRVYTASSTSYENKFRLTSSSSSGIKAYPDGNGVTLTSTPTQAAYANSDNTDYYWKCSGATTYFLFVGQSTSNPETAKPYVWVRSDLSQVIVNKKYQATYDNTNDTYSAIADCTSNDILTVNASTMLVENNESYTFTAQVGNDYEFIGWYSDPDCADSHLLTANPSYTYTAPASAEVKNVYPLARIKAPAKYSVHVDKNKDAKVTATWNNREASDGRYLSNIPAGATVTISGESHVGSKFTKIEVREAGGTLVATTGTDNGKTVSGLTFTMPSSNVTIKATTEEYWGSNAVNTYLFKQDANGDAKNPGDYALWHKVAADVVDNVKYNDNESDKHYYVKLPISLFTTTPTDYRYFALSNKEAYINNDKAMFWFGETVNVSVAEDSKSYLEAYDHSWDDYKYSKVKFRDASYTDLIDYVLLDIKNAGSTGYYTYSVHFKETSSTKVSFVAKDSAATYNGYSNIQYTMLGRYSTVTVENSSNVVQGTRTDYTTFTSNGESGGTNRGDVGIYTGVLTKGDTYTIKAVVTDPRYYVKAFNVNGVSVAVLNKPASTPAASATYSCTYKVPDDAPAKLEIIPVYYNYNDSNCVTFYLEGYDEVIQEDLEWGSTPYVYPYYATQTGQSSGGAEKGQNAFGSYPGQPLVCEGGVYYTQIPLTDIDAAVPSGTADGYKTETGTNIKGITISNGWNDLIHAGVEGWPIGDSNDVYHKQSYDYDDFQKIYNEKNPTNIYYRMKLREDRDNAETYRKGDVTTLSSADIADIGNNGNGWELLKDKFNRTIDLFGTPLVDAQLNAEPLYVISTGYRSNIAGDYGTEWRVYKKVGGVYTLQTATGDRNYAIPPSLLFVNNAANLSKSVYPKNTHSFTVGSTNISAPNDTPSTYANIYNALKTNCTSVPVYVSYEQNDRSTLSNYHDKTSSTDTTTYGAWRLDGRWYYTSAGDLIDSKIEIQYLDGAGGYQTDTLTTGFNGQTNKGVHTGSIAYFTDDDCYGKSDSGKVVLDSNLTFSMTAEAGEGYEFAGWYIKQDNAYPSMNPSDKLSATATTKRSSSSTYVARFRKLSKGELTVSNSNDDKAPDGTTYAGTGKGLVTVWYTTNGTAGTPTWTQVGATDSASAISVGTDIITDARLAAGHTTPGSFKLKVTLGNTPDGEDRFALYYNKYSGRTSTTSPTTYELDILDLFSVTTEETETVYTQNVFSLPFFTYFTAHTYSYEITYTYTSTRLKSGGNGAVQSFTKTGTIASASIDKYVEGDGNARRLTDAFVDRIKPKESNFRQNMSFTVSNKGIDTSVDNHTTFTAIATYTNIEDTQVNVTLDLPYAVKDRVADGGYDLTAEETNPNFGTKESVLQLGDAYWYDETLEAFPVTLAAGYGKFLTHTAVAAASSDDLLTAPDTISVNNGGSRDNKAFSYWLVTDNEDNEVVKVFSKTFNYRLYDNYTLKPVYGALDAADNLIDRAWANGDGNKSASISYLGTTRNQWNNNANGGYIIDSNTNANTASDILFNDFMVAFNYKDKEIKDVAGAACGIVLEKIDFVKSDSEGTPIIDMSSYEATAADNTDRIIAYIQDNSVTGGLTLKTYSLNTSEFDNKNRCEFFYNTYNSISGDTAERRPPKTVYRAYSYIMVGSEVVLSDPIFFTMYGEAH